MGGVVLVWLLQGAAVIYILMSGIELGDVGQRLMRIVQSRSVRILFVGLIGFVITGIWAGSRGDLGGAAAATSSFYLQAAILVVLVSVLFWAELRRSGGGIDMVFGSAKFATAEHAHAMGLVGESGLRLGTLRHPNAKEQAELEAQGIRLPLHYTGERHLLTVAPTRAGKGVSVIIPNLKTYSGSALAIDPKGENAIATYDIRAGIGKAYVLDPWGITGKPVACFNPLDMLTPDSPTLIEDALLIADALVTSEEGTTAFWADEARALIMGYLLHLATCPDEAGQRHLGRLRDMLVARPSEYAEIGMAMARSPVPAVVSAAGRFITKSENERSGLLSTAQRNTHFLDSPALRANLSSSSFRFADLKGEKPVSIYIVLPVDRLSTYSRWLRLLIALGIAELSRIPGKPQKPVWFVLDEFAQLGRLQIIEDGYGLMAGLGLQLHAIVQDLSQLQRLYGAGWQTFIANAGVIQVFGTRDLHTAEYVSKMLGTTTRMVASYSSSTTSGSSSAPGGGSGTTSSSSSSTSHAPMGRPLLFPDELMRMDRNAQILLVENADPILGSKILWE